MFRIILDFLELSVGARNRDRTGTAVRPRDFKSLVSTNFTIRAGLPLILRQADTKKGKRSSLSLFIWSGRRVSNSRPQPWQGCALPTELLPQNLWRRGPESNRPTRICNPVHNRFATAPRLHYYMFDWSGKRVSNSRPQPWQGCALPTELFPRRTERAL